ncbi:MAG: protein-disulfide reductase DsbD domain-containing protein, partial [Pseudomonadota bacterium]|nr:protein-disulfide reductase DsbD domain-containing protein [Pseudomonadota bacterium]
MNIRENRQKAGLLTYISRMVCILFLLFAGSLGAIAAQSNWDGDPQIGEARLISAVSATGDLDTLPLGVEFTLASGWKIYWRTPGEAGLAPVLDLSTSSTPDLVGTIKWPLPKRFDAFGFDNFGYENAVILPFDVTGHEIGAPVMIVAELEALACADICVPLAGRLEMTLPDGDPVATPHAQPLAQFAAMVPRRAEEGGISASGPLLRPERVETRDNGLFVAFGQDAPPIAEIFVEGQETVAFKAPEPVDGGFFMQAVPADQLDFSAAPTVLTISAPPQMAEIPVAVSPPGAMTRIQGLSLRILALALLGGLILNLMPCVLPVLALKLSAVIDAVGASRRELRFRFLAGAAGIVTGFLILAAGLAILRLAGGTVGWGIQFQNPAFLIVMMVMLGVFAMSLLDLVVIPVPRFAQGLAGASGGVSARPGYSGDFLAGMLATILATPCSAPFVGTAVAVALSGGLADLFGIFIALGIGLAAPWLLVAARPSLVGFLPRPGPWMPWLKRGLALLLAGTMLWLGTVLASVMATGKADDADTQWAVWSPAVLEGTLEEGRPVLVDVTADWCVTCKANKALVLDRAPVAPALAAAVATGRLTLLRADWTRPDPDIAAFLAVHGRYGIPFNILLKPAGRPPVILPE